MDLTPIEWKTPQICGDCREMASEGWQELKHSEGGPYIEKRCHPCAVKQYGEAELKQLGAPIKKKAAVKAADMEMTMDLLMERMG